ncbi:hypothetical protein PGTUg99_017234 [Puccinia graminis f. sp. tritici]|uniref:Uncharacterized protein n=1 Tax=Puccinia graminis f. sp. tritici TaxID=56615 RepID=A0A5B0Q181_PUCGR|nr:hypothetical protein PGTUg99_017234 [Puccinia graminis f. sp. tritici]
MSKKLAHLKVSGSGCVATVNLALAADKGGHGQDEILVNNAPLLCLIVNIRHRDTMDLKVIDSGTIIQFCGTFIGEETDSGIIRLL